MTAVLIIDDDEMYCEMLSVMVKRRQLDVACAATLEKGLLEASRVDYGVIFLDVHMPDGNGLDYLPRIKETPSRPEVIILTGAGDPDGAEMAIRSGAWAYVQKGSSIDEIILPLARALQYREEKSSQKNAVILKREGIVGHSPKIRSCLDMLAQGAPSNASFLVTGETGTGKELFARAIHENSPRSHQNFVVVDCAALPETLVESVLFGHAKGAYTGADRAEDGLVAQADQGTLFLDEVGELPLSVQKAFLRVLQERSYRPVGGQRELKSDFRLVAATNRNLDEMADQGLFRRDLLFRLKTFVLELPPLRECLDDLKELSMHYMVRICERNKSGIKGFSPDFLPALTAYNWPGNVRELVNTLDRAIASAHDEPTLYRKHLPSHIRIFVARTSVTEEPAIDLDSRQKGIKTLPSFHDYRESMQRKYIQELMEVTQGDIRKACQISKLSRSRFYDLLKKYDIARPA